MTVIGIDPGLHGGLAVIDDAGGARAIVMPLVAEAERDRYDVPRLKRLLATAPAGPVFVERLHPLPAKFRRKGGEEREGGGGIANYNRGAAVYLLVGLLEGLGREYQLVLPQVWQRLVLAGVPGESTKARSVAVARRLFPGLSLLATARSRKPHDGLADALCIAEYGRRSLAIRRRDALEGVA